MQHSTRSICQIEAKSPRAWFLGRATPMIGQEGPFSELLGVDARYDARALLTAGRLIGPATRLRFYVLHCIFIPLIAAVLMIVHFWRVRKDGGLAGPL